LENNSRKDVMGYTDTVIRRIGAIIDAMGTASHRATGHCDTWVPTKMIRDAVTTGMAIAGNAVADALYAAQREGLITIEGDPNPMGDRRQRYARLTDLGIRAYHQSHPDEPAC
jgi:hypothetical protein